MSSRVSLNHIGIAVGDLPALKKLFAILGMSSTHTEDVPDQGVRTHFLPVAGGEVQAGGGVVNIELLEPVDPEGTVARFVKKRGPGIHHLSFEVPGGELDRTCEKLRSGGYELVYEKPRSGAHGMRINFIHPAKAGGVLIELMERA